MKTALNHLELFHTLNKIASLTPYCNNRVFMVFEGLRVNVMSGLPRVVMARRTLRLQEEVSPSLAIGVDFAKLRSFLSYAHSEETVTVSGEKQITFVIGKNKITLSSEAPHDSIIEERESDHLFSLRRDDVTLMALSATCASRAQPRMAGVFVSLIENGNLSMSPNDGYRFSLAWATVSAKNVANATFFVPGNAPELVDNVIGDDRIVKISRDRNSIVFETSDWRISANQLSEPDKYPLEALLSMAGSDVSNSAQVDRIALIPALTSLAAVKYRDKRAGEINRVTFQMYNGSLILTAYDGPDEMQLVVPCEGDDFEFGVAGSMAKEGVKMFDKMPGSERINLSTIAEYPQLVKMHCANTNMVYILAQQHDIQR